MQPARALLFLALAAVAAADCTPCSQCRDPDCWRTCNVYCPPSPDKIAVNRGSTCMDVGASQGPAVGKSACNFAMAQCRPKQDALLGAAVGADALGSISLTQCSKVAMGSCQQAAGDAAPCQDAGANGFGDCGAERFRALFHGKATDLCQGWARTVTDVDPASGKWAAANPGGSRRLLL